MIHYRVRLSLDLQHTYQHKNLLTKWRLSLFWKKSFNILFVDFQSALSSSGASGKLQHFSLSPTHTDTKTYTDTPQTQTQTQTHYVSYEFELFRLHLTFLLDIISVHTYVWQIRSLLSLPVMLRPRWNMS